MLPEGFRRPEYSGLLLQAIRDMEVLIQTVAFIKLAITFTVANHVIVVNAGSLELKAWANKCQQDIDFMGSMNLPVLLLVFAPVSDVLL